METSRRHVHGHSVPSRLGPTVYTIFKKKSTKKIQSKYFIHRVRRPQCGFVLVISVPNSLWSKPRQPREDTQQQQAHAEDAAYRRWRAVFGEELYSRCASLPLKRSSAIAFSRVCGIDLNFGQARAQRLLAYEPGNHVEGNLRLIHGNHVAAVQHQEKMQVLVALNVSRWLLIHQPNAWKGCRGQDRNGYEEMARIPPSPPTQGFENSRRGKRVVNTYLAALAPIRLGRTRREAGASFRCPSDCR